MKNKTVFIVSQFFLILLLIFANIFVYEFYYDNDDSTLVERYVSEDECYGINVYQIGKPAPFKNLKIRVNVEKFDNGVCIEKENYFKTEVCSGYKNLSSDNFSVKWTDNGATLTVRGEEQPDCTYLIIWDNVFKG